MLKRVLHLDFSLDIDTDERLSHVSIYEKRDDFIFTVVNFTIIDSNIHPVQRYGVNIFHIKKILPRCCHIGCVLKSLNIPFLLFSNVFNNHHYKLVHRYDVYVSHIT